MQTERMSSKRRNTKAPSAPKTLVRFRYSPELSPHMVQEFKRTRGLPRIAQMHQTEGLLERRVRSFKHTVNNIVPPGTAVTVWPAIDMTTVLAFVAPERFGPESGNAYTLERGANTVEAKTLTRGDGSGHDIVVSAEWFINAIGESADQVEERSRVLAHLAAHEPQHIVLRLAGLDGPDVAAAAQGASDTVNSFLPAIAEAVNEYQAEAAANRIALSPYPHRIDGLGDDLAKFRESLAVAARLTADDAERACVTALTAAKELVKGIAYAAAYRPYDDDRLVPDPLPEQWDRYMAALVPDLLGMFATIPAAGDPVELPVLAATVYRMTEYVLGWLEDIGFTYRAAPDGQGWAWQTWWNVTAPI